MGSSEPTAPGLRWLAVAVVAVAALAGVAMASTPAAAQDSPPRTGTNVTVLSNVTNASTPDPASDRLGWENGVWYNETLAVNQSDGISEAELAAVVSRTMARVERVRGIEFDRTPPVRLISRAQQQRESDELVDLNATQRRLLNQQYEALFLINESMNAVESRRALLGGVRGYYSPEHRNVTMVSPPGDAVRIREGTLAQELFHAQQDNQFRLPTTVSTIEERNVRNVVVEGDANYVEYLYRQRCAGTWSGTCYVPENNRQQNGGRDLGALNVGMSQIFLQPYNSGVDFVRQRYRTGGWSAVDVLYEDYPDSTEQAIHPEKYPEDEPTDLTVPDRSSDTWAPPMTDGEQAYSSVGEPGLFVSLWHPGFETRGNTQIIPLRAHYNLNESGGIERPVSYRYNHSATAGWDGDRLVPYRTTDGTNRTGYVYELAWDSPADAAEFTAAYRDLVTHHGGEALDGYVDTYRFSEESGFGDVIYIDRTGDRLTIVNAPDVEGLQEIRPDAAPVADNGSVADNATRTPSTTDDGTTEAGESGPGFGVVATLVALAAALVAGRRLS
jgi:PGF-CTERM protein